MRLKILDLKRIAEILKEQCPFIIFAFLKGMDKERMLQSTENLELCVYVDTDTGTCYALEKILAVMTMAAPEVFCEVILLNFADRYTRFQALQDHCLFVRVEHENHYLKFLYHTTLDYRIMRAQERRRGISRNDVTCL